MAQIHVFFSFSVTGGWPRPAKRHRAPTQSSWSGRGRSERSDPRQCGRSPPVNPVSRVCVCVCVWPSVRARMCVVLGSAACTEKQCGCCSAGFGVDQLRDDNLETYWQSDGSQPHLVNIQFR